ncbi:MAG: SigB/SigF/SigG family RNA polymerase sigma factor [Clostridiales bacterium]|nr:SigB/SigF/SigG family RNA polymerase sigma factor [Clostridiales bacterium]
MLDHDETIALIALSQEGDDEAKARLIAANAPLVKSVIRRYRNKGAEYDDLFQLGCIGLLKAINHFDNGFGVRFSTYAVPMIAGEVKRFLRDDGYIKVSRALKVQSSHINAFIEDYKKTNADDPTIEAVAAAMGMDAQEVVFAMDSSKMPVSLYDRQDEQDDKSKTLIDKLTADGDESDVLEKLILKEVIAGLPPREKKIIILRYFRDKTQSEIAKQLGVSQVQVSRLESKIIEKLKKALV